MELGAATAKIIIKAHRSELDWCSPVLEVFQHLGRDAKLQAIKDICEHNNRQIRATIAGIVSIASLDERQKIRKTLEGGLVYEEFLQDLTCHEGIQRIVVNTFYTSNH